MASVLKVDKLDPQSGTALEIGTSGDTISVPSGATLDISSATLTPPATMPASSGVNFTALNATNLGSGTVPTARLGTGTASSSTILHGDNTWAAAAAGGKVLQTVGPNTYTGAWTATTSGDPNFVQVPNPTAVITLASTSSKVLLFGNATGYNSTDYLFRDFHRVISGGATTANISGYAYGLGWQSGAALYQTQLISWLDSPSTTSEITYSLSLCNDNGSATVWLGYHQMIWAIEIGA